MVTRQILNSHAVDVPRVDWQQRDFMNDMFKWDERYPNFRPAEIACKCCGHIRLHFESMASLQYLRSSLWKSPLRITSGTRCEAHNRRVGGAANSLHKTGQAFDIWTQPWPARELVRFVWLTGQMPGRKFRGIGIYPNFTHIDTGPMRVWEQGDTKLDPEDRNDPQELE